MLLCPENVKRFSFHAQSGFYRFVMKNNKICLCPMSKLSDKMIAFVANPQT
jgi:hypothetical protein